MDLHPYIEGWRRRREEQRARDALLASEARALAERLARVLADRYGVRRVSLIGSLARGDFREGSDVDLVVEGLPEGELFRAGAELQAVAGPVDVDLLPLESANPLLLEVVQREGIVLHG